jgi:hypothetical protein
MKELFASCLVLLVSGVSAQQYNAGLIPDSLRKNANMVVRNYEMDIIIKSPSKAIIHEKYAYTILNHKGDDRADFATFYNKLNILNNASGRLYDASGKELKHIKEKDMSDRPYNDGFSLMQDLRVKTCDFNWQVYPYTVEYEQEYEMNGILYLDSWSPQEYPDISVERSKFLITAPKDYQVRFKNCNGAPAPVMLDAKSDKQYEWGVANILAREEEHFSPEWRRVKPFVLTGPSDFEIEGYKGNMQTWKDYGKFYYSLLEGRDILPDNEKKEVHELVDKLADKKAKIAALYGYMQNHTHYISVQLGLGGWQPFDAKYVATNRYGDCKALSNYMVSLLKEAGIQGNSVIIKAGRHETDFSPDFVCDQFNHVICCVPLEKDTLWLECTSQFLPAGYLGNFTADRYALLVDKNGGALVHTPVYRINDNIQTRNIEAVVDENGNLQASVRTSYKAACQDKIESLIDHNSKEEQLDYLKQEIDLPTFDIVSLDFRKDYSALLPVINEQMKLTVSNYAQVTGKRLFIDPNLLNRSITKYEEDPDRKYDIDLKDEFQHQDSVVFSIPSGYSVESLPKSLKLETEFGKYISTVSFLKDRITYTRVFLQYSGNFSSKKYSDLVKFYDQIYRADRSLIVLVKDKS